MIAVGLVDLDCGCPTHPCPCLLVRIALPALLSGYSYTPLRIGCYGCGCAEVVTVGCGYGLVVTFVVTHAHVDLIRCCSCWADCRTDYVDCVYVVVAVRLR